MRYTNRIQACLFFSLVLLFCGTAQAQHNGKIAGVVRDKESGEALPGANVLLEGTTLGAATDAQGKYVILAVAPGRHTLRCLYIGYQNVRVENVVVKIDRSTQIDIELQPATLDLGTTVTVTAERPIVEIDKTSSSIHFEAGEVNDLPVEGLRNILELSPGINKNPDGTISVRGGGAYEVNYSVNGIKSLNTNTGVPAYGTGGKSETSWKYDINPLAVAQLEVISGGFNAEYGNAQSGVVKVVTREGGPRFNGAFIVEYRPPGQYHWGDYIYSHNQIEWRRWGDLQKWLGVAQFIDPTSGEVDQEAVRRNYELWVKNHTPSDDNILGVYDYRDQSYNRYLFSFGGPLGRDAQRMSFFLSGEIKNAPTRLPTREKVQRLHNYSLVLSFKPKTSHHLKLTGLYQSYFSGMGSGSEDIRWAGLWGSYGAKRKYTLIYDSPREESVFAQSLNYRWIFSPRSFLEATLTHQYERLYALQTPTPATDVDKRLPEEERRLEDPGPWFEKYRTYYTWSSVYNQASVTHFYEVKANFTSQLSNANLFKAGFEASVMDQDYNAASSLCVSAFIWRTGFATNYKAKTWSVGAYLQDKLEFAGMVSNIGLRLDAYNFGTDVPKDKHAVFYPALGSPNVGTPEWEASKTFTTLSPRLGISFPIGDKTAFRVQYGHFRSMPTINQALDNQTYNGWGSFGNPNLKPKLSINYEVGIQQNLWNTHQLDVVTYYNDLKDQISLVYIHSATGSQNKADDFKGTYISYENNGYGNSRGIEISFANRNSLIWRYRLAYTLSQTNYGYYGTYLLRQQLNDELAQKYQYSASDYLAPEDRTHRLNASLTYAVPQGEGVKIGHYHPFSDLAISLIYRVSSGLAYFWSPEYQYDYQVEGNRRYPMESQTDLRVEKAIKTGQMTLKAGLRVLNLFDNKHLTPISGEEDLNAWVLRSATYMDPDLDPMRDSHLYNYFQAFKNIPRQLFVSLGLEF
ncbi:TonB-dependent receptor [candidate division KSB1 bacterium]|nr:TonB-dependent receptor [candidate division KSB1 bacterium]